MYFLAQSLDPAEWSVGLHHCSTITNDQQLVQAKHVIYQILLEWLDQSNFIDGYVSLDPLIDIWSLCQFSIKNRQVLIDHILF